jgi:hypothetical protein
MQFEAVWAISMRNLALEVGGQVDNGNGVEGALLWADTASDAEALGNEGQPRLRRHFNAELAATDDGASLLALLATFTRATLKVESEFFLFFSSFMAGLKRGVFFEYSDGLTLSLLTMAIL